MRASELRQVAAGLPLVPLESAEGEQDMFVLGTHIKGRMLALANVVTSTWHFPHAGEAMLQASHQHAHQTLVAKGRFRAIWGSYPSSADPLGQMVYSREVRAPCVLAVSAGLRHQFVALEDDSLLVCFQALRKGTSMDDVIHPDEDCEVVPVWHI